MQDDDVDMEDPSISGSPSEDFIGKPDRWTKQVRSPWIFFIEYWIIFKWFSVSLIIDKNYLGLVDKSLIALC